ncbi:hypothetical protein JOB18_050021 [Solea senegalensis]|uniref:Uncharacterized protein n=1 Tax=Solea senegalensis TaxID=28829 RepID=A0AAV6RPJ7_SOLSE|nr:uncharacterized protein si:ch211-40k21.5 isoform X1 [Solea senegalensis]KAG7506232.1 hypothetical protein JOB18_050021 [Solea senegalensis]
MEDHNYYMLLEKTPSPELLYERRKKRLEGQRVRDSRRQRVNLGAAFPRWRSFMKEGGFQNDAEVACFLLDSFFRKRCHNDSCLRLRKKAMNLQNTDPECRDMWETASEDSSSDDDCVASICLRLSNRPEDEEEEEEGEEVVVGGTLEI